MSIRPVSGEELCFSGRFAFAARHGREGDVQDAFDLEIIVPKAFPKAVPQVVETGGRIPRLADNHINGTDGTLCLGSPLSVLLRILKKPTLVGFAENCLVPYLFALSRKLSGGVMSFGELDHGMPGLRDDYQQMLGLKSQEQVAEAFRLLGMKKRRANKEPCPCGCGVRLGRCGFNQRVRALRSQVGRQWFRTALV